MWAMRCCGSCAPASPAKCSSPAAYWGRRAVRGRAPAAVRPGAPVAPAAQRDPGLHRARGGKGELPKELGRLQRLLARGLAATAAPSPALRIAYGWVHQAARFLANAEV